MELSIGVAAVLDVVALVVLPPKTKGFALRGVAGLFVGDAHVVTVGGGLLLGVAEDDRRDGLAGALAEGAALGSEGGGDLGLEDVGVVGGGVLEAGVLAEAVLVGGVAPGGGGLVPASLFLGHGDVSVVEEDVGGGPALGVEVGGVGVVAAHVVRRVHALVLPEPVLA